MAGTQVNLYEAKTKLSSLVERAAKGEEIVIAKAGKPMARLTSKNRQWTEAPKPEAGKISDRTCSGLSLSFRRIGRKISRCPISRMKAKKIRLEMNRSQRNPNDEPALLLDSNIVVWLDQKPERISRSALLCMRRLPPRLTKSSSVPFQCGKLRSKGDWDSWILPEGWGRPSRGMVSSLCRSLWSRRSGRDRCRNFIAIRLIGCWWRRPSLKGWFWSRLTSKYCGTRFRILLIQSERRWRPSQIRVRGLPPIRQKKRMDGTPGLCGTQN